MNNKSYSSKQEAEVEDMRQTKPAREAGLAKGGKSIVKRKQPLTHVKPATILVGGSAFLPNSMSHSTKHVSGYQSIELKREASQNMKDKKRNEGPSDSAKKPIDTRNETTGMNQSTVISQNTQGNSWQKKITRDEQQSTSWFDWIMCGACSTQPELVEKERKSLESAGRAPFRMDSVQKNRDLLVSDEKFLNEDLKDRRNRLQPAKTFDELDQIIFEGEPVLGILRPLKNKTESDDKVANKIINEIAIHRGVGQKLAEDQERERVDGTDASDNLMIDIDESTPVSQRTQVLLSGRCQMEQASSIGYQKVSQNVHQNQKNPQEDLNSLKNNNQTASEPEKSHSSNKKGDQTTGAVLSNSKITKFQSYQHDYQKEIRRTKQEEEQNYQTAIATSQKQQNQRFPTTLTETKRNFEIHDDSSISSNKSIPEENEETSFQLLTNQTHLSGTEVGGMTNTNAMNRQSNVLTLSQSIQTGQDNNAQLPVLKSSHQSGANLGKQNQRFTSEKVIGSKKTASLLVTQEEQNGLIEDEQSGKTGKEEDSSCVQFARLEQQIYAEEQKNNLISSSYTTSEVVVVSMTHNLSPGKGLLLDDDDEFFRIERECQAYQHHYDSTLVPTTLQEAKMAKDDQAYSNKTTPIDKDGPTVTLAIKRHSTDDENKLTFQEQIDSRDLTPNIDFQIKQFDSLTKSDNELMFGDTENKSHGRDKAEHKRNQTSTDKNKFGSQDLLGPQNIQNNTVERNFNRQYQQQQQLIVTVAPFEDSLIPAKERAPVEQKRLPPPAKISQHNDTSAKSPYVNKKKFETQLTFGTPQINSEKKTAVALATNQKGQNSSSTSKLQTNQSKPGTAIPMAQGKKNATPGQSSIGTKIANVTTTEESQYREINQTSPNAQLGNHGQSNIEVNNKRNLALKSRQKETIVENSAESLVTSQPLTVNKMRTTSLSKTQKPVIQKTNQVKLDPTSLSKTQKPPVQRSTSTLKKTAGQKSKMAEIIERYATVATIDLTVKRQDKKTEDKSIIAIHEFETPKQKGISDALHQLGKSMRSSSQTTLVEVRHQRSMSIKSLAQDPSTSRDLLTNSIRQKSFYQKNINDQNAQTNHQNKARSFSLARRPPAHNVRTSIYTDSESYTPGSKQTPTVFQGQPQPVQVRRTSNYLPPRRSSRAQEMNEIYDRYASQVNIHGQKQFDNAIRQLRRSARTPSSRGQQQEGSQQNLTNTDICFSSSSQLPTPREQRSDNPFSNTSHISSKRFDLIQEHQEPRDRIVRQEALKNSPPPRISSANRRISLTKKTSQVSQQTAMFGNIVSKYIQEQKIAYGTLDSSKDLPPLQKQTTGILHQSSKEQLIEDEKGQKNYVHQRKNSMLQSQQEFEEWRRFYAINQNLPSEEEIARFLAYQASSKQMVRKVSVKQISPRNQRSAVNIHVVNPSPRQNKSRAKLTGFFDAKIPPGKIRVGKEMLITSNQQMGGSMMFTRRSPVDRNKTLARSMSQMQNNLLARNMVSSHSKRSLSVRHERSQQRVKFAQESPTRLSKIMSQKELTTAKKHQLERRGPSTSSYNRLKIGDTPLSRNSRNSPGRHTPREMTRLVPADTFFKTKPKLPANITAVNKRRATLKKQSSEYAIVNVQGSINPGSMKTVQVGGQHTDESMVKNTSSTRQLRAPQNGQLGNAKTGISKKTTLVTNVKRAQKNQNNSTNQIQSSQNNNTRGNEANKIRSNAKWN